MKTFGKALKELRLRSGMSQKQLAEQVGITKSVISYYELSERSPSPDVLVKIADVFQVSTDYLLGRNGKLFLDVSGMPKEDIKLLENVLNALKKKNHKIEKLYQEKQEQSARLSESDVGDNEPGDENAQDKNEDPRGDGEDIGDKDEAAPNKDTDTEEAGNTL